MEISSVLRVLQGRRERGHEGRAEQAGGEQETGGSMCPVTQKISWTVSRELQGFLHCFTEGRLRQSYPKKSTSLGGSSLVPSYFWSLGMSSVVRRQPKRIAESFPLTSVWTGFP